MIKLDWPIKCNTMSPQMLSWSQWGAIISKVAVLISDVRCLILFWKKSARRKSKQIAFHPRPVELTSGKGSPFDLTAVIQDGVKLHFLLFLCSTRKASSRGLTSTMSWWKTSETPWTRWKVRIELPFELVAGSNPRHLLSARESNTSCILRRNQACYLITKINSYSSKMFLMLSFDFKIDLTSK